MVRCVINTKLNEKGVLESDHALESLEAMTDFSWWTKKHRGQHENMPWKCIECTKYLFTETKDLKKRIKDLGINMGNLSIA